MFMTVLQGIIAIPKLIDQVGALVKEIKELRAEGWFKSSGEVFARLGEAKTSEERKQSAKDLGELISGL